MSVSLSSVLGKPASEVVPPEPLPNGIYVVRVTDYEFKAELGQNKNPAMEISLEVTQAVDVDPSECELPKKQRTTFWLTEQSLYRFKDFLTDVLQIEGGQRTLEEMLPEMKNRMCQAEIIQKPYTGRDGKQVMVNDFKRFLPLS